MKKITKFSRIFIVLFLFLTYSIFSQVTFQPPPPCQGTIWNGSNWSNGLPDINKAALFFGNFTILSDLTICSIYVAPNFDVTVTSGTVLNVLDEVTVIYPGNLIFENNASLIQTNPNAFNSGSITYKRNTPLVSNFDYTYWSSPVQGQILSQIFNSNELPLFDKYFFWNASAPPAPSLANFYHSGNWANIVNSSSMNTANGYIIRGPQSFSTTNPGICHASFYGTPNNGTLTTPMIGRNYVPSATTNPCVNTKINMNFIGNPYPSALDADSFLSDIANTSIVGGAIYQWSHNTQIAGVTVTAGDNLYNYTRNDYTVYNRLGGVGTGRISNAQPNSYQNSNRPNGKIAAGQGFFIQGINTTGGNATFSNDMRDPANTANNQFYKGAEVVSLVAPITKNRIWVSIENPSSLEAIKPFKETLMGFATGATNGYDRAFDAKVFTADPTINIYSLTSLTTVCEPLTIQGRALLSTFDVNDVIPLGYSVSVPSATTQSFTLSAFGDGIFNNINGTQRYFLRESVIFNGIAQFNYYDIKNTPYTFTATSNVTDNTSRFAIVFKAHNTKIKNT